MSSRPVEVASRPSTPDWRSLALNDGIVTEPGADGQSMALWFRGERVQDVQHWERVNIVPHAEFTVELGICATGASAAQAKQQIRGFFGKLWPGARKKEEGRSWVLPNGETAYQCGERQNDLILVWGEGETASLDETWIKGRWPKSGKCQRIGKNLFLVAGVEPPNLGSVTDQAQAVGCPRQVAERLLASARQAGDRQRELAGLTDLGIVLLNEGNFQRALPLLEEALTLTRQLGDRSAEGEALGNLGLAALKLGQPGRALPLLQQALDHARAAGDRFAEKATLERLGFAYTNLRDPARALASFEEALALARAVGHRKHEGDLLWYLAIQLAESGQRDQAIAKGQAAVELMEKARNPQAIWYADHLRRFRAGESGIGLAGNDEPNSEMSAAAFWGSSLTASLWSAPPGGPQQATTGPGLLRMALSAAKSMAKFLGSGLKTVPAPTLQRRLRTCAACEHHTGLRCRLCGCFTNAKARMAHEECPIGKW